MASSATEPCSDGYFFPSAGVFEFPIGTSIVGAPFEARPLLPTNSGNAVRILVIGFESSTLLAAIQYTESCVSNPQAPIDQEIHCVFRWRCSTSQSPCVRAILLCKEVL